MSRKINAITRHPKIHAGIIPSKGPIHKPSLVDSRCCAVELFGKVSGFDDLWKRIMEQTISFYLRFLMQIKRSTTWRYNYAYSNLTWIVIFRCISIFISCTISDANLFLNFHFIFLIVQPNTQFYLISSKINFNLHFSFWRDSLNINNNVKIQFSGFVFSCIGIMLS